MSPSGGTREEYRLVLLPGKVRGPFAHVDLYDRAYAFWRAFWKAEYRAAGSERDFVLDDFQRQDVVLALFHGDRVLGILCHSYFDIDRPATHDLHYFDFFSETTLRALRKRGVRFVQSFEFLCVDPLWRRRDSGAPLAEALISCGLRHMKAVGRQAAIAIARKDVNVHGKAAKMGFQSIEIDVTKRNFVCDTIACFLDDVTDHPDAAVRALADHLWKSALDARGEVLEPLVQSIRPGLPGEKEHPMGGDDLKAYCLARLKEFGKEAIETFPWKDADAYSAWLAQTYYYVSHSTRLLALAASRFPVAEDTLHQRFLQHAAEEKRHEFLALGDLKTMGKKIDDCPELTATRSFYQVQYYWIQNVSPKAFFGYILMLEGLAVLRGGWIRKIVDKHYPKNVSRFLKIHSEEDPGHLDKAFEHVSGFSAEDKRIIRIGFDQSLALYGLMLKQAEALSGESRVPLKKSA